MPQSTTEETGEVYASGTPIPTLFGESARTKILSALYSHPDKEHEHNISQIARRAGVTRGTVYSHLDELIELGIVIDADSPGETTRYQLNLDNVVVHKIGQLEQEQARRAAEEATAD